MRVIAGAYRRRVLFSPKGVKIRPTSDKIKETLFNMINDSLYDAVFLDLFSGTGQIGIEALSRGAKKAVFIDFDRESVALIKKNLSLIKAGDEAMVIQGAIPSAIKSAERFMPDIIFMDPPYDKGLYKGAFEVIRTLKSLDEETMIIAESALDEDFSYLEDMDFYITKEKRYKTSKHVFVAYRGEKNG